LLAEFVAIALTIRINFAVEVLAITGVSLAGGILLGPRQVLIDDDHVEFRTNLLPTKRTLLSGPLSELTLRRTGKICRAELNGATVWFSPRHWRAITAAAAARN
jgi:hypothetical protein